MGNPETDTPETPPGGEGGDQPPPGEVRPKKARRKKKGKGGRKKKLTTERLENLTTSFVIGCSIAEACDAADISTRTFERWMAEGRKDRRGPCWQLVKEVARINSKRKHRWLTCVNIAAETNPAMATWLLERFFPKEFHLGARIHVTQEFDNALERLERILPPAVFEQVLDALTGGEGTAPPGTNTSAA